MPIIAPAKEREGEHNTIYTGQISASLFRNECRMKKMKILDNECSHEQTKYIPGLKMGRKK